MFRAYRGFLSLAIKLKYLTIAITIGLFVASILAMPLIPRQFFPSSDRPELLVDISLPQNASIYASEAAAERFDALLKDDPDVERWSTNVGRGAIRFYLPLNVQLPNSFFSQAVIVAKDVEARDRLQAKLEAALAEQFPNAIAPRLSAGTRAARRLAGAVPRERARHLRGARDRAEAGGGRLRQPEHRERQLRLAGARAAAAHPRSTRTRRAASASARSRWRSILQTVVSGVPVTQIRDDIYLVNVVARGIDDQRVSINSLRTLQVPLPGGRTVPLAQFATLRLRAGISAGLAARPGAEPDGAVRHPRRASCRTRW